MIYVSCIHGSALVRSSDGCDGLSFWGLLSNCTKSKKRDKVAEAYHYIRLLKHPTDRLLKHATNRLRSQATGEQMSDIATP